MLKLEQKIPKDFQDSERWFKYFNTKSLAAIIIIGALTIAIASFLKPLHLFWLGIVLGVALLAYVLYLINVKVRIDDVEIGAGMSKGEVFINKLCCRRNGRTFLKVYRQEREEAEND